MREDGETDKQSDDCRRDDLGSFRAIFQAAVSPTQATARRFALANRLSRCRNITCDAMGLAIPSPPARG